MMICIVSISTYILQTEKKSKYLIMKRKIKDVDTMMESNEKIENNISTNTKTNVHDNNNLHARLQVI